MKKNAKIIALFLAFAVIFLTGLCVSPGEAEAKTKNIVICKLGAAKLTGYKAYMASDYLGDIEWENVIGAGKKQTFAISPDCKYYLIDYNKEFMPDYRVSKKVFLERVESVSPDKSEENGKTYYWGMACKLVIKDGKVTKVIQQYQP